MDSLVLLLFFYKDGFGIKLPSKIAMPLETKETKANQSPDLVFYRQHLSCLQLVSESNLD